MRRALVIPFAIAAGAAALAAPGGFTVHDLVAMDRLAELASSGAHSRLAFTVSSLDAEANRRRTDIWTVDAKDGGAPVRLTADPASDTSPARLPASTTTTSSAPSLGSASGIRDPPPKAPDAATVNCHASPENSSCPSHSTWRPTGCALAPAARAPSA